MAHFGISHGKGFSMAFANGYTLSVQFGPMNYCQHYVVFEENVDMPFDEAQKHNYWKSYDAEIAILDPNGEFCELLHDSVHGYCSPDQVAKIANLISGDVTPGTFVQINSILTQPEDD